VFLFGVTYFTRLWMNNIKMQTSEYRKQMNVQGTVIPWERIDERYVYRTLVGFCETHTGSYVIIAIIGGQANAQHCLGPDGSSTTSLKRLPPVSRQRNGRREPRLSATRKLSVLHI
jgi:hypothetical protein